MTNKPPFFKRCPKSGKIVGISPRVPFGRFLLPVLGLAALLWFMLRTFSKPSRMSYPCQQVAAPLALWFLSWAGSLFASWKLVKIARAHFRSKQWIGAGLAMVGVAGVFTFTTHAGPEGTNTGVFIPKDKPNTPIGEAKGIRPGRVSWIHDPQCMSFDGNGKWPEDQFWKQDRLDNMLQRVILDNTGSGDLKSAWKKLFEARNALRNKVGQGYVKGEKIAIKINLNNRGSDQMTDASPHIVKSLLRQLIDTLGVAQEDILVYDAIRAGQAEYWLNKVCGAQYPKVRYNNLSHPNGDYVDALSFSDSKIDGYAKSMPRWVAEADYMINFAMLKKHTKEGVPWEDKYGQTGITGTAKNHFGTTRCPSCLHSSIQDWYFGDKHYNVLVDLMSIPVLREKTVIYLMDGLLTGTQWDSKPAKWNMAPFNGKYPASVFASMDPVAMESVALDLLSTEFKVVANADNYLHEAALIANPPSGYNYIHKGTLKSLGVHEHWNNAADKKYSRNLGTGQGIELVGVPVAGALAGVSTPLGRPVPLDISLNAKTISIRSGSELVSAQLFDMRGRNLSSTALSGRETTIVRPSVPGGLLLRVIAKDNEKTVGL